MIHSHPSRAGQHVREEGEGDYVYAEEEGVGGWCVSLVMLALLLLMVCLVLLLAPQEWTLVMMQVWMMNALLHVLVIVCDALDAVVTHVVMCVLMLLSRHAVAVVSHHVVCML